MTRPLPCALSVLLLAAAACGSEPDGTFDGATPVALNSTTHGTLSGPSDEAVYRVATPGFGVFRVTLTGLSANADLDIYDDSHRLRWSERTPSVASESAELWGFEAATYYVVVRSVDGATEYTLTVTFTPYDGNDTFAAAQDVSLPFAGASELWGDRDYYRFTVPDAGWIDVSLTNLSGDADLYLYDGAMVGVGYSENASTIPDSISWFAAAGGTHYVLVSPWALYRITYDLSVAYTP